MKRLLLIPLIAICACSDSRPRATPAEPAAIEQVSADMSVDEMVDAVPHSTLHGLCSSMSAAFDAGASTSEVAVELLKGLDGVSGPYSEREIALAIIAWCVDHGYE